MYRTVLVEKDPRQDRPLSQNNQKGKDQIPPKRKTEEGEDQVPPVLFKKNAENHDGSNMQTHSSVCIFVDTSDVTIFTHCNYTLAVTVGLQSTEMRPINCVLDTGTGTSLI